MPETVYSSSEQMAAIVGVRTVLDTVLLTLAHLQQQGESMASNLETIQGKVNDLTADVAAQTTVIDSAVTLINGIVAQNVAFSQQIKDLIASGGTPEQFKKITEDMDAANAAMDASRKKLGDAVVASTPAA